MRGVAPSRDPAILVDGDENGRDRVLDRLQILDELDPSLDLLFEFAVGAGQFPCPLLDALLHEVVGLLGQFPRLDEALLAQPPQPRVGQQFGGDRKEVDFAFGPCLVTADRGEAHEPEARLPVGKGHGDERFHAWPPGIHARKRVPGEVRDRGEEHGFLGAMGLHEPRKEPGGDVPEPVHDCRRARRAPLVRDAQGFHGVVVAEDAGAVRAAERADQAQGLRHPAVDLRDGPVHEIDGQFEDDLLECGGPGQGLLGAFLFGHVRGQADDPADTPVGLRDGDHAPVDGPDLPAQLDFQFLADGFALPQKEGAFVPFEMFGLLRREQVGQSFAQDVVPGLAEELAGGLVDRHETALGVLAPGEAGEGVEEDVELVHMPADLRLCLALFFETRREEHPVGLVARQERDGPQEQDAQGGHGEVEEKLG